MRFSFLVEKHRVDEAWTLGSGEITSHLVDMGDAGFNLVRLQGNFCVKQSDVALSLAAADIIEAVVFSVSIGCCWAGTVGILTTKGAARTAEQHEQVGQHIWEKD
jgi:hypothetical protein